MFIHVHVYADSRFGAMSMVPNLMKKFGWNPAGRFHDTIIKVLQEKTGVPNITFGEVHALVTCSLPLAHVHLFSATC